MTHVSKIKPLTYIFKPDVVFWVKEPTDEGLLSDIHLNDKKIGRIDILPIDEVGSMYDTTKTDCVGAMMHLWLHDTTGEYFRQINAGKIFAGVKVKAYFDSIVSAELIMEDTDG